MWRARDLSKAPFLALGVVLCCAAPVYAEAYLEVTATPQEVVLGDTFTLRISVVQSSDNLAQDFAVPQLTLPDLPHLEVVNYQTQTYRVQLGDRQKMNTEAIYILRPQQAGTFKIPALEQPYQEGNRQYTLRSETVVVNVVSAPGQLRSLQSPGASVAPPQVSASPLSTPSEEPLAPFSDFSPPGLDSQAEAERQPSLVQRFFQGGLLLLVLVAGVAVGIFWRKKAPSGSQTSEAAPETVIALPAVLRYFPESQRQLEQEPVDVVLQTFRRELMDNLHQRGALSAEKASQALSNQEILQEMQRQLVPMAFYERCQALLKKDEALRYQGTEKSPEALRQLLQQAESIFQKT